MAAGIPVEMMSNSTLPLGFLHSSIAGHELTSFYIFRYFGNVNSAGSFTLVAHQDNDRAVMTAYGFPVKTMTESQCVAELFKPMWERQIADRLADVCRVFISESQQSFKITAKKFEMRLMHVVYLHQK